MVARRSPVITLCWVVARDQGRPYTVIVQGRHGGLPLPYDDNYVDVVLTPIPR